MKLKLTPELFILQDAASQPEIIAAASQDENKEEKIENKLDLDNNSNLKYLNRTKRFIDTPAYQLLNKQKDKLEINNQKNDEQIHHLEPNIRIIERNGKIIYDKRFVKKRRTPKREVIQSDIRCVQLNKEKFSSSFGLTIRGGLEFDKPLIISSIQRNSVADKCRSLFLGDLIVELNGNSVYPIRLTHEQSMKLIKTGGNKLHLTVKHLTMYNRPISRFWQRQLNMLWLNNKEENDLNEDWTTHSNQNKQSINNSSMNSSLNSTTLKIDKSSNQLINYTDTQKRLSNLTVSITTDKEDNSQTPSPNNDEGVYTGLSNDALSSSECTESEASCFSSDYIQSSLNSNQQTNLLNSNGLSSKNELNFIDNNESSLSDNKINCLSIDCKNRKNNNSCMKCIINKNHENYNNLSQRHTMNYRNSINQNTCFQSIVDQELLNNFNNKENSSNFSNFAFRSSLSDYNKATSSDLQRTIKNSCLKTDPILGKCNNKHSLEVDCLQNTTEYNNLSDQYNMEISDNFKQKNNNDNSDNIRNSNEFCSCKNSLSNRTSSSNSNRNSNNLVDIVSVNLINCYFTKYIHNTDNIRRNGMEVRWFDLHNKITKNKTTKSAELNNAIINFNDNHLSEQFQEKIAQYLSKLNESYMFSFNRGLKAEERILFMGWISLALPKTTDLNLNFFKNRQQSKKIVNSLDYNWQPKYMIIRGGELRLYDYVPDYVLEKIYYTNDTLMEFNELSNLLLNKNGTLECSIILNNNLNQSSNNLNKQKLNTQLNRKSVNRSKSLTRHLSIRGQDSSINLDRFNKFNNDQNRILTETNNNNNKKTGNRFSTLTRNLSLKTAKENRFSNGKNYNNRIEQSDLHCTLPRNKSNQFTNYNNQMNITNQQSTLDRKQNLKRTTAASNLFTPNEYLLNQKQDNLIDDQEEESEMKWQNKPIIFKAYQSVLRELKSEEQLDRRENCLLALTTHCDNTINNSLTIKKQSVNLDNSWYDNCENENQSTNNEIKKLNTSKKSNSSMVAYLAVEHSDNISQILKSWNVSTMHSVIQITQKSFIVTSEGNYCKLVLDWHKGFTLYDNNSSTNIRWSFKFSQLKNSSDNGMNTLWLSFQSIEHQPISRQIQTKSTINNHQSDNNSSLNSSMDSVDQYSQRSSTQLNRAITPCSFDSSINSTTMNSSTLRSNKLNNINSFNNDYYLQTNRNEFKIKKSIETKELTCNNLQHLIYCIHSFLAAKVTSVSSSMPTTTTLN